jgi:glucose dehydrogenase
MPRRNRLLGEAAGLWWCRVSQQAAEVVIIGSGVAGALVAARLARAGVKVVILEAGPKVVRGEAVQRARMAAAQTPESAYEDVAHAPFPRSEDPKGYYVQDGPDLFTSTYQRNVGGTTWHWLGTALRFGPNDFRLKSRYGVGLDWPVSYAQLEPWYGHAEKELGVAGDDDADLGVTRSTRYPMSQIPPTLLDKQLAAAVAGAGIRVVATPQARNSTMYNNRPPCCGNASCIPCCPIGAKYDATIHVDQAVAAGAQLITPAVVTRLETDASGAITAAVYRDPVNEQRITARIFVLAAHAIEGPRLLLLSKSERYPNGLANSSDQVGRNLMDHPTLLSYGLASAPIYPLRSPLSTSGIEQFRDGDFRRTRGGFRIEIGNDGWSWPVAMPPQYATTAIQAGHRGPALRKEINTMVARQFRLASLIEMLPDPENRVTLDPALKDALGLPRPHIRFRIGDYSR